MIVPRSLRGFAYVASKVVKWCQATPTEPELFQGARMFSKCRAYFLKILIKSVWRLDFFGYIVFDV